MRLCSNGPKRAYDSEKSAKRARDRRRLKQRLYAYLCPYCRSFHLTSSK